MASERSGRLRRTVGLIAIVVGLLVVWELAKFIAGDPRRINGDLFGFKFG